MPFSIENEYTIYSNATNQVAQTGAMAQTALAKIASIGQGHLLMYFLSRFLASITKIHPR